MDGMTAVNMAQQASQENIMTTMMLGDIKAQEANAMMVENIKATGTDERSKINKKYSDIGAGAI